MKEVFMRSWWVSEYFPPGALSSSFSGWCPKILPVRMSSSPYTAGGKDGDGEGGASCLRIVPALGQTYDLLSCRVHFQSRPQSGSPRRALIFSPTPTPCLLDCQRRYRLYAGPPGRGPLPSIQLP